jgi:hypothetical protein
MKSPIAFSCSSATLALAEPPEAIQRVTLDERVVVTVPSRRTASPPSAFPDRSRRLTPWA